MIPKPRALVLSPSASHPQDYGNRNRVWQLTSFLKRSGYAVDFLFYPFEGEWNDRIPAEADDMRSAWDSFWVVPPTIPLHRRALGEHHEIDEWWDEAIGNYLSWLFARRSYDVLVVNYTFLSKAFTYAPRTTVRVLETHDVFSGRKEMLAALGSPPEFFYTTAEREKVAFDRADIVIAIKDSEAALIQTMTDREVLSLPFFPSNPRALDRDWTGFKGLSVGFIGAMNNINTMNFRPFLEKFDRAVRLYCPPLRLLVAGDVCRRLHTANPAFELMGKVDDVEAFYAQVDVIAAPMTFSTGIKVKVGEALGFGKGVVSTVNGFDGYPAMDPMHALASMEDVSRALIQLAFDDDRRVELIAKSRMAAQLAGRAATMAYKGFAAAIRDRARRTVFIVDEPFWDRATFRACRLVQWAEFCASLMPVIVFHLADGGAAHRPGRASGAMVVEDMTIPAKMDRAGVAALAAALDRELEALGRTEVMCSLSAPWAGDLCAALVARGHAPILDLWCPPLAAVAARAGIGLGADLWAIGEKGRDAAFEARSLRYPPNTLDGWPDRPITEGVMLVRGPAASDAESEVTMLEAALHVRQLPLDVIAGADEIEALERFFDSARLGARPRLLLSIAGPGRLRSGLSLLSSMGAIPYLDIRQDSLPLAVFPPGENPQLICNAFDLIERMLDHDGPGLGALHPQQSSDTGWSRLWRLLETRRISSAAASGQEQALAL